METLNNLETLTIVSFAAPFFLIALLAIFYIITLRSDNTYLRKCLTKNKEAMQEERKLHKDGIKSIQDRNSDLLLRLREAEKKIELLSVAPTTPDIQISQSPILAFKAQMRLDSPRDNERRYQLNKVKKNITELIWQCVKETKIREPYSTFKNLSEFEIKVVNLNAE